MAHNYLDRLSEFVADTRFEDLPPDTIAAARDVVLDTLGAITAGSRLPENANFARLAADLSGPGKASIIGHPHRAQPVWATMVNATAGVALEMDEGNRVGGGHPSIHVTPGALAVGEDLDSSGRDVLTAIILGYEVISRVGTATEVKPEVHSHGTWGTIGTAAATARLMGFDAAQTKLAMNLAMSMSPANTWTPCLEGATVRNLYPGRSGFQGIMAAHLSQCGYTAVADGPADLYATFLGDGFNPDAVVDGLGGDPYRIQQNYFKFHACCLYNHPALGRGGKPAAGIALRGGGRERHHRDRAAHRADNGRRRAGQYAGRQVLHTLRGGGGSMLRRNRRERVPARPGGQLRSAATGPAGRGRRRPRDEPAPLRLPVRPRRRAQLNDGRALESSVISQRGDATNPAPRDLLLDKFRSLAAPTLDDGVQRVIDAAGRLDNLDGINELTTLLSAEIQPASH